MYTWISAFKQLLNKMIEKCPCDVAERLILAQIEILGQALAKLRSPSSSKPDLRVICGESEPRRKRRPRAPAELRVVAADEDGDQ